MAEVEAFIQPARYPSQHQLHRAAQLGQSEGRPISSVAVRAGAIDDEQCLRRPARHPIRADQSVRQIERARNMGLRVGFRTPDVEKNEVWGRVGGLPQGFVDIGAVGLQRQAAGEMRPRLGSGGWRSLRNNAGAHIGLSVPVNG